MAWTSKEFVNKSIQGVAQDGNPYISGTFTTKDPRFVVVTVKCASGTGALALMDSSDNFQTEDNRQQMALVSGGVTILRFATATNGILRNQLRAKLIGAAAAVITSVNVCYEE